MTVWKDCKMTTVYYDETMADDEFCDVRIDSKVMTVSYKEEGAFVIYEGHDLGGGHFHLHCKKKNSDATLHLPEGGKILEGYWEEESYRGFWRIYLT